MVHLGRTGLPSPIWFGDHPIDERLFYMQPATLEHIKSVVTIVGAIGSFVLLSSPLVCPLSPP
jgi:hypothetical protein